MDRLLEAQFQHRATSRDLTRILNNGIVFVQSLDNIYSRGRFALHGDRLRARHGQVDDRLLDGGQLQEWNEQRGDGPDSQDHPEVCMVHAASRA